MAFFKRIFAAFLAILMSEFPVDAQNGAGLLFVNKLPALPEELSAQGFANLFASKLNTLTITLTPQGGCLDPLTETGNHVAARGIDVRTGTDSLKIDLSNALRAMQSSELENEPNHIVYFFCGNNWTNYAKKLVAHKLTFQLYKEKSKLEKLTHKPLNYVKRLLPFEESIDIEQMVRDAQAQ